MSRDDVLVGRRSLSGTLFAPDESSASGAGVLFVHGSGSNRHGYAPRAETVVDTLRAVCLTVDLSGHGDSHPGDGPWRVRDHLEDVADAYDALVDDARVDSARIGVCGASYGAYLSGRLAALRAVDRLVLRAPALYDDDVLDRRFDELTSNGGSTTSFFQGIQDSGADVLIVESGRDELIKHETIEQYRQGCPGSDYALIAEARHGLEKPEWDREFVDLVIRWFDRL